MQSTTVIGRFHHHHHHQQQQQLQEGDKVKQSAARVAVTVTGIVS